MGTLDEAIREHLELKRRAGADPGEVAKQEREAFGPVRREDALTVPPAGGRPPAWDDDEDLLGDPQDALGAAPVMPEDIAAQDPTAFDDSLALRDSSEALGGPVSVPFEDAEAVAPPATELFDPFAEDPAAGLPAEPVAERPRAPAEPLPPAVPPSSGTSGGSVRADAFRRDPEELAGERTEEFSALDHADAADPQPDAEPVDELEETPEFLEETPEHDRLWFEQKPPRDFDF